MKIQVGQVKYKGRDDYRVVYGTTDAGKIYYFDPKKLAIKKGDHVIVETARGIEYGSVVANVQEVTDDKVVQPLKAVIRIANAEDDAKAARNKEKEKDE